MQQQICAAPRISSLSRREGGLKAIADLRSAPYQRPLPEGGVLKATADLRSTPYQLPLPVGEGWGEGSGHTVNVTSPNRAPEGP